MNFGRYSILIKAKFFGLIYLQFLIKIKLTHFWKNNIIIFEFPIIKTLIVKYILKIIKIIKVINNIIK